jgi:hypothetical protein
VGRSGAARPGLAGVRGETAASRGTPGSGSAAAAAAAAPLQREREAARRRRKAKPSPEPGQRDLDPASSRSVRESARSRQPS